MSYPEFSDFPPIPQRSAAEADFDTKMSALFQHFATTHRAELIALIDFLKTNSTIIGGALNATTVGLDIPAAGKFTGLEADSLGGAAVQSSASDTDGDGKLVRVDGAGAAALSRFGFYKAPGDGYNIDQAVAGDRGLVSTSNPGTWPSENPGSFAWVTTQASYSGDGVLQRAVYGYASTGTPDIVRTFERSRANDGSAWSTWVESLTSANLQADPLDVEAGKLLTVGAFGAGVAISLGAGDDLNTILTSGSYYNSTGGNTTGNNYPISSAGSLHVVSRTSTNVTQRFSAYGGASLSSSVRIFERSWGQSGWTPWVEIYHQGRILGAVSQSGGVPTGAIIERGSNANGDYARFADGMQICTRKEVVTVTTSAAGSVHKHGLGPWTFPSAFVAEPLCYTNPQGTAVWGGAAGGTMTTLSGASIWAAAAISGSIVEVSHFAIGYWF